MELSLEEIIRMKKNNRPSRPALLKKRQPNIADNKARGLGGRLNGRVNKSPRQPLQGPGTSKPGGQQVDARLKIIQKNRQRMTDARDKLAELAKKTDARTKIRGRRMPNNQNERQGVRGRVGYRVNPAVFSQSPVLLQRSVKNNVAANLRDPSSMIRCTINRTAQDLTRSYGEEMDIDEPLPTRNYNDFSGIQVALRNEYTQYARQEYIPSHEPYMDTYDPPMFRTMESSRNLPRVNESRRMSLEMRARLDTPARSQQPRSSNSPPPVQPQGHRIVVSNLHSSVTHEDIKELFEDIGPLITSRLVRAGTAEVIYKFQKDAKKAVDAYHNRQLDGQPMKCLLVNARPTSSSSGVLRSNNMSSAPKFPSSSKSMVVPDLSAIHKALFTSK